MCFSELLLLDPESKRCLNFTHFLPPIYSRASWYVSRRRISLLELLQSFLHVRDSRVLLPKFLFSYQVTSIFSLSLSTLRRDLSSLSLCAMVFSGSQGKLTQIILQILCLSCTQLEQLPWHSNKLDPCGQIQIFTLISNLVLLSL